MAFIQKSEPVTVQLSAPIDLTGANVTLDPTNLALDSHLTNVQANPGSNASKGIAVQGVTNGKPIPVIDVTEQLTGTPSNFAPDTADQTVFTLAAGEVGFIQNLSADAPLAVKKGAGASTTSFNLILAPGTDVNDGKGGLIEIDDWVGAVSVAKITGTARYIAWKQAP